MFLLVNIIYKIYKFKFKIKEVYKNICDIKWNGQISFIYDIIGRTLK